MSQTDKGQRYRDLLLAFLGTVSLVVIVSLLFDCYYEFNDDVLMKNILSGAYTGTPESHNIQMLWPISALIALIYRIIPGAPVYGMFLCVCQYTCVGLLTYRAMRVTPGRKRRILVVCISFLFAVGIILPHLVMIQYTITVAILAATASFIFYTIPDGLGFKQFLLHSLPAILIVVLAFWIRSEMLLLMFPYIAITGFVRWNRENSLHPHVLYRYIAVVAIMVACLGLSFGIDKIAYSSPEWKSFLTEFNARTQLYDYQYVPEYEENIDFYKSIGLTQSDVNLLKNYDYGINEKIDADIIGRVASYADELRGETFDIRIKKALKEYLYRITHIVDGAYQVLSIFLYLLFIWAIVARKESTLKHKIAIIVLRIGGLWVMRSVSWFYIVLGHRQPDRIVHSLYIIEIVILFAMLMTELTLKIREKGYLQLIAVVVLIGGIGVVMPITISNLNTHIENQTKINRYAQAIDGYCKRHPENFYFEDVYTTIRNGETFNEKMMKNVDNSLTNYDLIGGWACNSPLYYKKLENFGITDVSDAVLNRDDIYIICDHDYSMDWVTDYYADREIEICIEEEDVIMQTFGVYKVSKVSK